MVNCIRHKQEILDFPCNDELSRDCRMMHTLSRSKFSLSHCGSLCPRLPRSLIPRSLKPRRLADFSTTGLIRSRPRCGLGHAGLLKSCCAASLMRRWHGRVTDEVRWPATKEDRALQATATAAADGR